MSVVSELIVSFFPQEHAVFFAVKAPVRRRRRLSSEAEHSSAAIYPGRTYASAGTAKEAMKSKLSEPVFIPYIDTVFAQKRAVIPALMAMNAFCQIR